MDAFVNSEDFLSFLLSPTSVPASSCYQRDESKFKLNRLTIHAMVHVLDPSSPHVYDYLKAREQITGLSSDGFDVDELKAASKRVCMQVIDEFFTSSPPTTLENHMDDDNPAKIPVALGMETPEPVPDPFCSIDAFYELPEVPLTAPPPNLILSLAEEDSHQGRVLRQEEHELLGLGTLRLLIDVTWFERSPVQMTQAELKLRGSGKIDAEPGQMLAEFDGQGDLESADKLAAWLVVQRQATPPMTPLAKTPPQPPEEGHEVEQSSLSAADKQRKVDANGGEEESEFVVVDSSSSTIKGGGIAYNFFDGVPVSIKPPGYGRERRLRHTIASRLSVLPYVSHPLIVQILIESDASLPD